MFLSSMSLVVYDSDCNDEDDEEDDDVYEIKYNDADSDDGDYNKFFLSIFLSVLFFFFFFF